MAAPEALQIFIDTTGAVTANTAMDRSAITSPRAKTILGWLGTAAAPMAHANSTAPDLEELHRQPQLLLNGKTTVDEAAAALDKVAAIARQ